MTSLIFSLIFSPFPRISEILRKLLGLSEIFRKLLGLSQIFRKSSENYWDYPRFSENFWDYPKTSGIIRKFLGLSKKFLAIIRGLLLSQDFPNHERNYYRHPYS